MDSGRAKAMCILAECVTDFVWVDEDVDGGGEAEQQVAELDHHLPPERGVRHRAVLQQVVTLLQSHSFTLSIYYLHNIE